MALVFSPSSFFAVVAGEFAAPFGAPEAGRRLLPSGS
jgi:hypothetical protein